jgi:hypothetical protein
MVAGIVNNPHNEWTHLLLERPVPQTFTLHTVETIDGEVYLTMTTVDADGVELFKTRIPASQVRG